MSSVSAAIGDGQAGEDSSTSRLIVLRKLLPDWYSVSAKLASLYE
jgi:hypothetical protein